MQIKLSKVQLLDNHGIPHPEAARDIKPVFDQSNCELSLNDTSGVVTIVGKNSRVVKQVSFHGVVKYVERADVPEEHERLFAAKAPDKQPVADKQHQQHSGNRR